MKEIIEAQKQWVEAKRNAYRNKSDEGETEYAKRLFDCHMFKGTETLEEMIDLMFSPQGAEFLTRYNFPALATFRKFKKYRPERYGVYIDCGKITLPDPKRAFLVGNTEADIKCGELQANRVILMHGASATVVASGYAVVKIEKDDASQVSYMVQDHAKILA